MAIEKCIAEFAASEVIFEEGSMGRELYVVLSGQVNIVKNPGPRAAVVASLGKGEFYRADYRRREGDREISGDDL